MKYSLREAIRYIAHGNIDLTDAEISQIIAESADEIEGLGRKVREAAQAYEQLVIQLAADIVARRQTPAPEASMNESSQSRN